VKHGILLVATLACPVAGGCGPSIRETTTTTVALPGGGEATERQTTVDGKAMESLRVSWEADTLRAEGRAEVSNKYPGDPSRNRGLARVAARQAAEANLARQIADIRVSETVTVADLQASVLSRSAYEEVIRGGAEVVDEVFDEARQEWLVRMKMAKVRVLRIVETSRK